MAYGPCPPLLHHCLCLPLLLCAVLGFMAALSGELTNGESVFNQVLAGGAGPALLVILAVSVASFAPAVRQVRHHQQASS
jgi:hypothetical protein